MFSLFTIFNFHWENLTGLKNNYYMVFTFTLWFIVYAKSCILSLHTFIIIHIFLYHRQGNKYIKKYSWKKTNYMKWIILWYIIPFKNNCFFEDVINLAYLSHATRVIKYVLVKLNNFWKVDKIMQKYYKNSVKTPVTKKETSFLFNLVKQI